VPKLNGITYNFLKYFIHMQTIQIYYVDTSIKLKKKETNVYKELQFFLQEKITILRNYFYVIKFKY